MRTNQTLSNYVFLPLLHLVTNYVPSYLNLKIVHQQMMYLPYCLPFETWSCHRSWHSNRSFLRDWAGCTFRWSGFATATRRLDYTELGRCIRSLVSAVLFSALFALILLRTPTMPPSHYIIKYQHGLSWLRQKSQRVPMGERLFKHLPAL